jgi:plasmid rolling circle replication initiator protein Rep
LAVEPSYFDKDCDLYINQKEWRELWQQALGVTYEPYVDVRVIYDEEK